MRVYALLLWLFPPAFRREFGPDMAQLFRDALREARGRPVALARLWVVGVGDVLVGAAKEWARALASIEGGILKEGTRMDGWIQDARFAVRALAKRPAFTLAAVATLALGIAANVSMFSVVNGVLLRPLPYPEPDGLMVLWTTAPDSRGRSIDHPDVRAMQTSVPALQVAGYSGTRPTLTGFGDPEVTYGVRVTDGLITLMGLTPHLGRDIVATDDLDGGPRVVVVSHAMWSEQLGRDPGVLGRTLELNGEPWEIVGVAPEDFDFPDGARLWMPRQHQVEGCGHGCRIMSAVGRLASRSTVEEARSQLDALATALAEEYPNSHRDNGFALQPMLENEVDDVRAALWMLLGAVGMVLLIACANVANLMLVRSEGRRAEVALRATLGASRLRIVRQLLTESAVIAGAAGVLGIGLAHWGTAAFLALAPDSLPRLEGAGMEPLVLGFALLLVLATTALFGLLPALGSSRYSLTDSLGQGSRTVGRARGRDARSLLLVGEVALSVTLLLGTGLLLRSLAEVRSVELGFDVEGIERFRISLPDSRYDSLAVVAFIEQLERELGDLPGVEAAGWGFGVPFASGSIGTSVNLMDRPEVLPPDRPSVDVRPATVGFLAATGTQLRRGRWFEPADRYGASMVAVINEAAARAFYPDGDPIGRQLQVDVSWNFAETPPATIVGIVNDVVRTSPTQPPAPAVYLHNAQFAANTGYMFLRLAPGVATAVPAARAVVTRLDPQLALWSETRMEDVVVAARASNVFYASLLTAFSSLALLLAAVGLYGVVAYAVSQRTREIGIRVALGARGEDVMSLVLGQGARPAFVGLAVGLALSWFGARVLESMLFGVSPQDPVTIVGVTLVLLLVTAAATLVPARRASRIPAADALRVE